MKPIKSETVEVVARDKDGKPIMVMAKDVDGNPVMIITKQLWAELTQVWPTGAQS